MNKVVIVGRMVADPSVKVSQNGNKVCTMRVAVDDGWGDKKHTDFLHIVAFGKTAENCEKYLAKGRQVAVEGKIHTDSYEAKDGRKVYTTDIYANTVEFVGGKDDSGQRSAPKRDYDVPDGFEEAFGDEDLPF